MRHALFLTLLAACSGPPTETDGGIETDEPVDPFAAFISPTIEATGGALTCYEPGADWASTTWLTQEVDATLVANTSVAAVINDFEEDTPVIQATVDLWYGDQVSGAPDFSSQGDDSGNVTLDAPVCQPHTYRVTTNPDIVETKTTFKAHHLYGPGASGELLSVSDVTYRLIPTILGVAVDPDKAIIAGTVYGCDRNPDLPSDDDSEKVEGAQVIVYDGNGDIVDGMQINYFTESFPDRFQEHTSADGLWVASNIPPGELRVESWGLVAGELTLLGATELFSEPDSINIANIFVGYGDGVKYPSACLTQAI